MKTCSLCKETKLVSEFHKDRTKPDGLRSKCKKCHVAQNKKYLQTDKGKEMKRKAASRYYQKHRDRILARTANYYHEKGYAKERERLYGVTLDEWDAIFDAQGGVCAICGGVNDNGYRLYVDHDHDTGEVRGLLCAKCNFMLGNARDDVTILAAAIVYLTKG